MVSIIVLEKRVFVQHASTSPFIRSLYTKKIKENLDRVEIERGGRPVQARVSSRYTRLSFVSYMAQEKLRLLYWARIYSLASPPLLPL